MDNYTVWEEKYKAGQSLCSYPWDRVVSFIFRYYPRNKQKNEVKVLEVGFGSGSNLWFCSREGFDSYGVEGSPAAVDYAKQWFAKEGLKDNLFQGNFHPLRFENDFFDLVIDRGSLTCVSAEDCLLSLKEIYRVMASGGYFCFNPYSTQHTSCVEGKKLENGLTNISSGVLINAGDIMFYEKDEILALIAKSGFKIHQMKHNVEQYYEDDVETHNSSDWFFILEKI
jgi:ubiquinone/menaquinone biosynthesis C-methylase UbiE